MKLHQLKDVPSLIELVLILGAFQLRQRILLHLSMIVHFWVESLSVLRGQAGRVEDRIRLPSIAVPICPVTLEAALLGLHLGGLQVLIRVSVGWNGVLVGANVGGLGSAAPLLRLNR